MGGASGVARGSFPRAIQFSAGLGCFTSRQNDDAVCLFLLSIFVGRIQRLF